MQLEERRRQIELVKRKSEIANSQQQQQVGKAAFLHAINKVQSSSVLLSTFCPLFVCLFISISMFLYLGTTVVLFVLPLSILNFGQPVLCAYNADFQVFVFMPSFLCIVLIIQILHGVFNLLVLVPFSTIFA